MHGAVLEHLFLELRALPFCLRRKNLGVDCGGFLGCYPSFTSMLVSLELETWCFCDVLGHQVGLLSALRGDTRRKGETLSSGVVKFPDFEGGSSEFKDRWRK